MSNISQRRIQFRLGMLFVCMCAVAIIIQASETVRLWRVVIFNDLPHSITSCSIEKGDLLIELGPIDSKGSHVCFVRPRQNDHLLVVRARLEGGEECKEEFYIFDSLIGGRIQKRFHEVP